MREIDSDTRARGARQRGVTLLELLVALTLLSLVAWSVYAGIRTAGRSWEAAHARTRSIEDLRLVSAVLRSHLSRAYPLAEAMDDRGWQVRFDGTSRRVDFLAELPNYLGLGGLHEVSVRIETDDSASRLTMHRWAYAPAQQSEAAPPPEPTSRVLIDQLEAAELDYFGALSPDEAAEWHTEWREQRALPSLVRLRIETLEGPWPDLVVQPFVDEASLERPVAGSEEDEEDLEENLQEDSS